MLRDYSNSSVASVAVDEHVTVVRYRPTGVNRDQYDVFLTGKLILKGLANYEAGSIADVLHEAEKGTDQ